MTRVKRNKYIAVCLYVAFSWSTTIVVGLTYGFWYGAGTYAVITLFMFSLREAIKGVKG